MPLVLTVIGAGLAVKGLTAANAGVPVTLVENEAGQAYPAHRE